MNSDALRAALAAAIAALDEPDAVEASPEPTPIDEIIEAEADADATRIEVEGEVVAELIAEQAVADVEVIEAEAAADVAVIEAEAAATVAVIEAETEADESLDCPDDIGDVLDADPGALLDDVLDSALDVLDAPLDSAPLDIPDTPPSATHWYTRTRKFSRKV